MLREPGTVRETLGHRSSALEGLALHADVGRSRPHPGGIVEPVAVVDESAAQGGDRQPPLPVAQADIEPGGEIGRQVRTQPFGESRRLL